MKLRLLQTSLSALIKSRPLPQGIHDDYLQEVQASNHLLLIQKIAFWWRKVQVEPYCRLTTTFLKSTGQFDTVLTGFISEKDFSSFRDEVGRQFLSYVIQKESNTLARSVADFELAVILLKSGEEVQACMYWEYEPYEVIHHLLKDSLKVETLTKGVYEVTVSSTDPTALFRVRRLEEPMVTAAYPHAVSAQGEIQ
ncbi:MAG: hypothetical protein EOO14_18550 [Chitinophagaceae bacterium]|nr:MAG: hypothetical protein EOO14_18550 [Chitinophagaceae bacterium]